MFGSDARNFDFADACIFSRVSGGKPPANERTYKHGKQR